jgi:ketose-bisphosphate aldolase
MALEPVNELLDHACRNGYGIGYFESWNVESLQGVIDAAEETRSPIIIGFNGEFMSHSKRLAAERISWYGALGKAAAESACVPCGFIFNECAQDDWVRDAVTAGFNLVMPDDPEAPHEQFVRRVADIAEYAHKHGVAVEAEMGELPSGSSGRLEAGGQPTDPQGAAGFVRDTGIDVLSVSVGNVHIMVKGEQSLDLDLLAKIHKSVPVPLSLHGGTGITADSLTKAVTMGVAKVAYGTYLKQRYLSAVRAALDSDEANPHKLLSYGGAADVMVAGRQAVHKAVLERIGLLGCCGKA